MSIARTPAFPVPVHKVVALNEHLVAGISKEKLPQYRFIYVVDLKTGICTKLENSQGVFELVKLSDEQFACVALEKIKSAIPAADAKEHSLAEAASDLVCFMQVWDTKTFIQLSNKELFKDGLKPPAVDISALKVFADKQHIAGVVTYPNEHIVKDKNLGTYRPWATSVFITHIQSGVTQVFKPYPHITNITILPKDHLAIITFRDGVFIHPVNFQRDNWLAVHKAHLQDKKLLSLLGMIVTSDGKQVATYDGNGNFIIWNVSNNLQLTLCSEHSGILVDFDRAPKLLANGLMLYSRLNEIRVGFPDDKDAPVLHNFDPDVDSDDEDFDTDVRPVALIQMSADQLVTVLPDFSLRYFDNANFKYPERFVIEAGAHVVMPGLKKEQLAIISGYACAPLFFAPKVARAVAAPIPKEVPVEIQPVIDEFNAQLKVLAGVILNLQQKPAPKNELALSVHNKALKKAREDYLEMTAIKEALEMLMKIIKNAPRQPISRSLEMVEASYPGVSKKAPEIFDAIIQWGKIRDRRHSVVDVPHLAVVAPVLARRASMSSLK